MMIMGSNANDKIIIEVYGFITKAKSFKCSWRSNDVHENIESARIQ